jgi:hypothetical protein
MRIAGPRSRRVACPRGALVAGAVLFAGCAAAPRPRLVQVEPPPAPVVSHGEIDGRPLFGDLPVRALRLGAGPPALVTAAPGIDNEWIGAFVDVPRDACLLAYARAATSIQDIDLAIYSEEGTSLAVDEGRDVHPTVLLCAPHPDRVYVAAHVVEGEGLAAVGAQLVTKDRAVIVAQALGARGTFGEEPRPANAWPGLDEAVRQHRAELGGKWDEFKRIALPVDARVATFLSMALEADQCVDVVVVPDDDVALLDVEAIDGEGRVVGRASEGAGARTLTLCSPLALSGAVSVRPHVGRGLAAVVLARASGDVAKDLAIRPQVAWVATALGLDAARDARNALLAKRGYEAPRATFTGSLPLGRRVSVPLELRAGNGACNRVDVVAGAPLALLGGRIWSDGDALLASGESAASLALFACAKGNAHLDLETRGRPGPFAVTVRPERWADPAFSTYPLAASRMLARAAVGSDVLLEGKAASVRALTLGEAEVVSFGESVPPGKCLRVVVGAEGAGTGVTLRAFDLSNDEIDRAEAAHAAAVRVCARDDRARPVRFEVRGSAGRLHAVMGERLVDAAVAAP